MAKSKNDELIINGISLPMEPVLDADSGAMVTFTKEDVELLLYVEQQAQNAYIQLGSSLKTIRDRKLYLLRNCENFKEYIESNLSQSYHYARKLVYIADKITTQNDDVKKLSFNELYEIAKREDVAEKVNSGEIHIGDGKVIMPDGEEYSVKSFVKKIRDEVADEFAKEKKKIDSLKKNSGRIKENIEHLTQELIEKDSEIEKLKNAIDMMAQTKDIDPASLVFARTKKDASELISNSMERALKALADFERMPRDVIDAEIGGRLVNAFSSIEAALKRVQNVYHEEIFAIGSED